MIRNNTEKKNFLEKKSKAPIGMCKIRHRDDNGVAQGDRSKTKNY